MPRHSNVAPPVAAGFPTREEWLEFATAPTPPRPEFLLARRPPKTDVERKRLARERIAYHRELGESVVFDTPIHRRIRRELFELIELNGSARGARRAYAISGEPMLGKSTTLTTLGKQCELAARQANPNGVTKSGDDLVPVVYCTLDGEIGIKGVNRLIAEFYGVPTTGVTGELTTTIQRTARRCGTSLILIDDVHHLDTRYRNRGSVVDHFKKLLNTIPATFVFAGINAERGALLGGTSGPSSRAVRRRTTITLLEAESIRTRQSCVKWCDLLDTLAQHLLLLNAEPGDLTTRIDADCGLRMFQYLHDRTAGEIGILVDLLRRAANRAIRDGSERITHRLLAEINTPIEMPSTPAVVMPLRR